MLAEESIMAVSARKPFTEEVFDIKETCWDDVRDEVERLNPELAKICDEISPGKEHSLLKLRYPYGSTIVDKGELQLPCGTNGLASIKKPNIASHLKEKLSYSPIPLSLLLHNDIEIFVEGRSRVIPLKFFQPGDIFGVFETMNYLGDIQDQPMWSISAGGRSVFMLPRITDKIGHNRMRKELGLSSNEPPADLQDHWKVFKDIYERSPKNSGWYSEVLVFTDKWFQHSNDIRWTKFQLYVAKLYWSQTRLLRDALKFSLLWSSFGDEMNNRNLRPRPYLIDTLKHLLSIANGIGIAFKPTVGETALPVSLIQETYVNSYNLKNYIPTLMQPCTLKGNAAQAYYSLTFPTVLESTPFVRNAPSIIEDQRDIKRLLNTLIRTIKIDTRVINPIQHVKYDFFHSDIDPYDDILSSKSLVDADQAFLCPNTPAFQGRTFCSTSSFFKGCVRITLDPSSGEES